MSHHVCSFTRLKTRFMMASASAGATSPGRSSIAVSAPAMASMSSWRKPSKCSSSSQYRWYGMPTGASVTPLVILGSATTDLLDLGLLGDGPWAVEVLALQDLDGVGAAGAVPDGGLVDAGTVAFGTVRTDDDLGVVAPAGVAADPQPEADAAVPTVGDAVEVVQDVHGVGGRGEDGPVAAGARGGGEDRPNGGGEPQLPRAVVSVGPVDRVEDRGEGGAQVVVTHRCPWRGRWRACVRSPPAGRTGRCRTATGCWRGTRPGAHRAGPACRRRRARRSRRRSGPAPGRRRG